MRSIVDDLRFGLRLAGKNPAMAIAIVVVMALGIGANSAIFTLVDAVLIRPLPFKNPEQLAMLWETEPELPRAPVSGPDYRDWQTMTRSFHAMAAGTEARFNLTGAGEPQRVQGFSVAPNIFDVLGVHAALGRTFQSGEDQSGHERVVVLTYGLWQRAFGGNRALVGRDIELDGKGYTVVGIMPSQFRFPELWGTQAQAFVPLVIGAEPWQKNRGSHWLFVMGRLQSGVSIAQADAELRSIARNLEKTYDSNAQIGAHVVALREQLTGGRRGTLLILLMAVGFVLAIACANVANLMIAQASARNREMAIRLALGASGRRVVRQLLTESMLLSCLGLLLGLVLALWLENALLKLAPAGYVPAIADVHLNAHVFAFAAALAVAVGIVSGLAPAWHSARTPINETLKESGRGTILGRAGLRKILIVAEVASALVLLFGAGLAIQSLRRLLHVELGFNPAHVLTMKVALPQQNYPDDAHIAQFYSAALRRIRAIPGVQAAGAVTELPFQGGNNGTVLIEGQAVRKGDFGGPLVERTKATPGYFGTMGIPLIAGREFTDADESRDVAVINQTMARKFWPGQNAIGKRFSRDRDHPQWIEVIGVVADTREFGLETPAIPQTFLQQRPSDAHAYMNLVVRTILPPQTMTKQVMAAVHEVDKQLPVFGAASMEQMVAEETGGRRFNVFLFSLFAGLALLLAAVGIYGVMSYLVAQRTPEIGVRIVLGASRADIVSLVVGASVRLLLVGVAVGVAAALASSRLLQAIVFQVKPDDPGIIAIISLLLCAVALLASYLPARRAAKVDPMVSVRYE